MKRMTLTEMKKANKAAEQHWFSKGAMEFFNTSIVEQPNKYNMFITSERMDESHPIGYAIRYFNEKTSKVVTIGKLQQFETADEARTIRNTISKALEDMANRESWIMDNLSDVEFTPDWLTFIAYDNNEARKFDISYDGRICG